MPETLFQRRARRRAPTAPHAAASGRGCWASSCSCIAGLVVGGFFAAKFVDEALDVRADLEAAKSRLGNVTELVRSGDQAQFDAVATEVLAYTTSADETVQGPLWEFASWVPFVGQNVAAVRADDRGDPHPRPRRAAGELRGPRRDAAGEHPLRRRRLQPRAVPSGARLRFPRSMRRSRRLRRRSRTSTARPAADRRRRRRAGARGHRPGRPAQCTPPPQCCPPR